MKTDEIGSSSIKLPITDRENTSEREGAFSLLELMVVIATLAILVALVLPALAQTEDHGTRMTCMDNLRQMGMASTMYVSENRDSFPYANWDGGSGASAPRGWLYALSATDLPPGAPAGQIPNPYDVLYWKNNPVSAWRTGLWFQYVQNPKSYLCPVDIESRTYSTPTASGGRNNKLSTYIMNGAVVGYPAGYGTPCKITDAWSPACYLLWEPDENSLNLGNPGSFQYNDGANFPTSDTSIGRLHSANGGNMLCVGGNVEFLTVRTFKKQSVVGSGPGPGGNSFAWWAPGASNGN